MTQFRALALSAVVTAALTACGGGGGGGNTIREVPFTSFSAVAPNETVVMSGISQTASGTMTVGAGGDISIDTANLGPVDSGNSTARLTYNGFGDLSGMSFSTPQSSASYGAGQIDCTGGLVCTAENATSAAVAVDATAFGWNYQSYGVWFKEASSTTFQIGAMSAGAVTPGSAVPTTGMATFTGLSSGFYVDTAGLPSFTSANMTANVNFGTRNIGFSTTNTMAGNLNTQSTSSMSGLNLNGTLTYGAGSSQFSGPVISQDLSLTGSANGRFYGPNAEEIGGVFGLSGSGQSRMIGAFGGRQ
jgi:hypothetical protein